MNLGAIAFDRGDTPAAAEWFREALTLSERLAWPRYRAVCAGNLGQALLAAGEVEAAIERLETARRIGEAGGFVDVLADSTRALAEARLAAGDVEAALAAAEEALEQARKSGQPIFESQAHAVAMACLLAGTGDGRDAAHRHLEAAVAILRDSGREEEVRALRERFDALGG